MNKKKGFTIIEVVTVIVMISILLVIVIPSVIDIRTESNKIVKSSKIDTIITAAENYATDNINDYKFCNANADKNFIESSCIINTSTLTNKDYLDLENEIDISDNSGVLVCYHVDTGEAEVSYVPDINDSENIECKNEVKSISVNPTSIGIDYQEKNVTQTITINKVGINNIDIEVDDSLIPNDLKPNVRVTLDNNIIKVSYDWDGITKLTETKTIPVRVYDNDKDNENINTYAYINLYDKIGKDAKELSFTIEPSTFLGENTTNQINSYSVRCFSSKGDNCGARLLDVYQYKQKYIGNDNSWINIIYSTKETLDSDKDTEGVLNSNQEYLITNTGTTVSNTIINGETIYAHGVRKNTLTIDSSNSAIKSIDYTTEECNQVNISGCDVELPNFETNNGYDAKGYTDEKNGTIAKYKMGEPYRLKEKNKTLYPVIEESTPTYYLSLGYENSDCISTMPTGSGYYAAGENVTITAKLNEGCDFDKWVKTFDVTNVVSNSAQTTITMPAGNLWLMAKAKKKNYTITYNANGGSNAPSSQTKEHGKSITLSSGIPSYFGKNFDGWAKTSSGNMVYSPGDTYSKDENLNLYAHWDTHQIYNGNSTQTLNSLFAGQYYYFKFTPTETADYVFESTNSSGDTYGYLYDSTGSELTHNDDGGDAYGNTSNFKITYSLTKNKIYYYAVRWYDARTTGTIYVNLSTSCYQSDYERNGDRCVNGQEEYVRYNYCTNQYEFEYRGSCYVAPSCTDMWITTTNAYTGAITCSYEGCCTCSGVICDCTGGADSRFSKSGITVYYSAAECNSNTYDPGVNCYSDSWSYYDCSNGYKRYRRYNSCTYEYEYDTRYSETCGSTPTPSTKTCESFTINGRSYQGKIDNTGKCSVVIYGTITCSSSPDINGNYYAVSNTNNVSIFKNKFPTGTCTSFTQACYSWNAGEEITTAQECYYNPT